MPNFSEGWFITPHPDAPTLSGPDAPLILNQLATEISSGSFTDTEQLLDIFAEAGLVSLWFYLKFIAGFSGPFDKLNTDLHRDMANFRQSPYCMTPGAYAGMFVPRKHYKTTIFTEGGSAWELERNGNLCFRFTNAIIDRSYGFMRTVERHFDSNEFREAIYGRDRLLPDGRIVPAHRVPKGVPRWNDLEMVVPWRTRYYTEPSIKCGGYSGASAGDHHDVVLFDDLVDESMLNAMRVATADMISARNFFLSAPKTLVRTWQESRVLCAATRYGIDDCYAPAWDEARLILGWQDPRFAVKPEGRWVIYYRIAIENDQIIFPEAITKEGLEELARTDFWTYALQYMNNPFDSGGAELINLKHNRFTLKYSADDARYFIVVAEDDVVAVDQCDLVLGCDPAATEKFVDSKTSRTAIALWAMDAKGRCFMLEARAGYIDIFKMYDWFFDIVQKYGGSIRLALFEKVAFQRVLGPLLDDEMLKRGLYVHIEGDGRTGDKIARIRSQLATKLNAGLIYVNKECEAVFLEEKNVFPQARTRLDLLDASERCLHALRAPFGNEERELMMAQDRAWEEGRGRNATTGY